MHSTVTLHTKHKFLPLAHKWKASHPNQGHLEWSGYPEPEEPEEDADGLEKVTISFEEPEEAADGLEKVTVSFEEPEEAADGLEKVTVSFEEPEEAAVDWIGVCFYRIKRTIISTKQ